MIKKELVTIQSEAWFDDQKEHRYVFRRQWASAQNKGNEEALAVVVTIRPGGTTAYVEDLTMLLIEKNVRQLGFDGFIAVNLFSAIKPGTKAGIDDNTLEVISTVLKDKQIGQLIFACGSILYTNKAALSQARAIFDLLSAKQKKQTKALVDPTTSRFAHPLCPYVRKNWTLVELEQKDLEDTEIEQKS